MSNKIKVKQPVLERKYSCDIEEVGNEIIVTTKSLTDTFKNKRKFTIEDPHLRSNCASMIEAAMEEYEYGLLERKALSFILKDAIKEATEHYNTSTFRKVK